MRQCSPPVIAGGSRPKRALTIRATCPAGTIGTVGVTAAARRGAGWERQGGSAAGCAGGGGQVGAGLRRGGGASTPACAPGGIRFWPGPIEPGGRGIEFKSRRRPVCASARGPARRACDQQGRQKLAAARHRAVVALVMMPRFTAGNRANSSR